MEEKRNSRRMGLTARLLIKNMNDDSAKEEEVEIDVLDVSTTGVGFIEQTKDEKYICGTIFIGLPEMNARRIEVYDMLSRIKEGEE